MTTVLELGLADLAGTRFAVSPLTETLRAVLLLGDPGRAVVNRPWLDWARARLARAPLRMPRSWPLVNNGLDYVPEFLAPAPAGQRPSVEDELGRLRATPHDAVRASLRRVFQDGSWPRSATALDEDPAAELLAIADELGTFYQRLIAPHWERIRAVLDADIAYRAGQLAVGGARALFADLHPQLTWSGGLLRMDDEHEEVLWAQLGPDGIVLMPSVFNWPLVSSRLATSSQTTLLYPARGVATVWQALSAQRAGQFAAAEELIGATRARLLDTLRSPATTSALAQRFGVTPGAVSQHLGVLYRARLLTRQRSGAAVLYQASDLGLALLGAAVASTGGSAVPPHRGHDNRVMLNGKGDDVAAPGNLVIAVVGASPPEVPLPAGMPAGLEGCEFRFITAPERLAADAPDADVAFVWQPRLDWIENHWGWSPRLRWIAAASAGVDYLMFPELVGSDVTVTNSAGIFDDAMAEYALALIGAVCADLPATLRLQAKREWLHRETRRLAGREVLVLGAGGIGRATTRLLRAAGTRVTCLARTRRADPELGEIAALGELPGLLPGADFVVLALPHTPSTDKIIGAAELALMSPGAWLVNLGRGALVDEPALITALQAGAPGGAALDVFAAEPLAADSPLWGLPNVIVSPHMSGDARGWDRALTDLFLAQLARYRAGRPLENVVDKSLGFVPRAAR